MNPKIISLVFIVLFNIHLVFSTEITEFNYNPEEEDNDKEFIEVNTELDLTGFIIQDQDSQDILEKVKDSTNNIALIVEEGFNYLEIDANIYSAGPAIGNNLNNDEDFIIIKSETETIDVIHYFKEWGGNGNGKSLCKNQDNYWQECIPTPGKENDFSIPKYNIIINELLPDPEGFDNANIPNGEWIELYNKENFEIDLTNYKIKDNSNKELIISNQNAEYTIIKPNSYLVVYTNGFSGLLNNEGYEKILLINPENNILDEITYSFTKEGNSLSLNNKFWIFTVPSPNKENYKDDYNKESEIKIESISPDIINFGDIISIKLDIYKGDTTKKVVEIYIEKENEKISKTSKVSIEERFKDYIVTIPIQILSNCKYNLEEGNYNLIVKGLDTETQEQISITGINKENCETITQFKAIEAKPVLTTSESNINPNTETPIEITYSSKSQTAKRSALLLFCLALILIIIQIKIEKW